MTEGPIPDPAPPAFAAVVDALHGVGESLNSTKQATVDANKALLARFTAVEKRQRLNLAIGGLALALFLVVSLAGVILLTQIHSGNQFLKSCFKSSGSCYKQSIKAQQDPKLLLVQATINVCYAHAASPQAAVLCIQHGLAALRVTGPSAGSTAP